MSNEAKAVPSQADGENPYNSTRARNYTLGVLTLVYCFSFIDRQLLAILQESIKADLGLSDSQLGLLTGFTFALFYVSAGIPIARMADNGNRRNIISASIFIWSFMTAITGFAQNYVQLVLARIGVGIGEAGGNPPSQSMISDIFPEHRRATAMGIYFMGVNIGIMFGFLLGGWLNEVFGWRTAFMVVGLPGILIAILIKLTVAEPTRTIIQNNTAKSEGTKVRDVMALLWKRRSFRHLSIAAGLQAFVLYSFASWTASFLIRTHGMKTGEVGLWLAMILGVGGAIGVIAGGYVTDRLKARDKRWNVWLPAFVGLISIPFMIYIYLADTGRGALMFAIIPGAISGAYLGPTIATTHGLVGARMRALSSAIISFIINMIGLGCGPFFIGLLSDYLAQNHGTESLRYAMLYVLPLVQFWCVCHFFLAAKTLREDLAAAPD